MKLGHYLDMLWPASIRRQLLLGFALASFVLLLGFGYLMLEQQRQELYRLSEERAASLVHALSISCAPWALTNDLSGLQEVVEGFARTPDLHRAYFIDPQGEVLASTNPDEVGYFVTDAISRKMLASKARSQIVLLRQANLIVIAQPVMAEGRLLGWARLEMSQRTMTANLSELRTMWFKYVLFAIVAVSAVALLLARRLTRGLDHLAQVAAAVEHGWGGRRSGMGRADEIGVLARHLDRMLDALDRQKELLRESEAKYRFLADNTHDVIWVWNLTTSQWVYVSPSVEKLRGYTVEEVMAQTFEEMVTPESYAGVGGAIAERTEAFLSGADTGQVYTDEMEQRCRDGSTVWTEVTTHFARNQNGEPIMMGVARNISERKKAEEQIRNLAFYDTLTQLPNRRLLVDRFNLALSACRRSNRFAAMMFIDLDNFKPLNDEHGHDVGDILLVEVARRISSCVREVDTVVRFGGDEFVVMLSELDVDKAVSRKQAGVVAEKIRQILGEPYRLKVYKKGAAAPRTVVHHCTASIGVVLFNSHGASEEELIRVADSAMYQAKSAGRNRVHFANS